MDDLYLAVRESGATLKSQRRALEADRPLHTLWELTVDPRGTQLLMEFMALGNTPALPSEVISALIAAIGRLIFQSALGFSTGRDATLRLVINS